MSNRSRARARRLAGATAWVVGLGVAALALQQAGRGSLAGPPLTDPASWSSWLEGRGPIVAAFAILRLVALGGLWYVVLATLAGAALRVMGAASLVRLADRVTIRPLRRMLAGTVSLGIAASGVMAVAAPAMRLPVAAAQTAQPSTSTTLGRTAPTATITMHRLAPAEPVPARPVTLVPEVVQAPVASTERWTVRPGECFWSIAERVLADRQGRPPTDAEIVPYWQRLIDANRHELAQPGNPDLIFPGQVFTVPAPNAAG